MERDGAATAEKQGGRHARGLVVFGLLALIGLGWVKDNVVDFTKPQVWGSALALMAGAVLLRIFNAAADRA